MFIRIGDSIINSNKVYEFNKYDLDLEICVVFEDNTRELVGFNTAIERIDNLI